MKKCLILIALIFIQSCGGSNGDDTTNWQNPSGIWEGEYTSDSGATWAALSQITSEGTTYIYFQNGQAFYGLASVEGNNINIQGKLYRSTGVVSAALNGTITTASSISGVFESNFGESGDITLAFNDLYNRSSSLEKLVGTWTGMEIYSNLGVWQTWEMVVLSNGQFTSTRGGTCSIDGNFNTLNEAKNEYSVTLTIDCGGTFSVNGDYTGIAATSDTFFQDDSISMVISNSENIIVNELVKQ